MARIRIIKAPPGQAPDWVRKAWVGLEMETHPSSGVASFGALGGKAENGNGYVVQTTKALEVLEQTQPEAAQWWREHSIATPSSSLVFALNICQEI